MIRLEELILLNHVYRKHVAPKQGAVYGDKDRWLTMRGSA